MRYPVVIETGNDKTAFGVIVPDFPGVFSAGDTLDEALAQAEEAILFALEDVVSEGKDFPAASNLADLISGKDPRGGPRHFPATRWAWHVIDVDTSRLTAKAIRVNSTVPEPLLKMIDRYVAEHPGESRSGILVRGAQAIINR